jgi:hypothetical protein
MMISPDNIKIVKDQAAAVSSALEKLAASGKAPGTQLGVVLDFLAQVDRHLEAGDAHGYYEDETEQAHIYAAGAYALLAKAGARAIAIQLEHTDEPRSY